MRRILLLVLAAGTAAAEDLDSLTEKLRSPDPAAREAALLAIGRLGRDGIPAAPAVRAALEDADPQVRAAAAETLWRTSSHVHPLLTLLATDAREHARFACRRVGPDMLPALESAYRSRDVDRKLVLDAAVATLGRSVLGRESRRASWKARKEVAPAIERGLAWLSKNQESDGSWGSVRHQGWPQFGIGITALGALAFLGCHEDPANCEPLRKALSFLASVQKEDGHIGPTDYERHIVAHAFATLAFAEAALLCGERSDRAVLARAVPVLVAAQNSAALREAALTGQEEDGSWPRADPWSYMAGRVYSTAMMTLALEGPILYGDETAARARGVNFVKRAFRADKDTEAYARELVKSLDRP